MSFTQAVTSGLVNYFNFSGRAMRSEYWYFALFIFAFSIATMLIDLFGLGIRAEQFGPFWIIGSLATIVPSLSIGIRRLHDIDRSGWWTLLILVPLVGLIVLIYWACQPGTPGPNTYGPPTH